MRDQRHTVTLSCLLVTRIIYSWCLKGPPWLPLPSLTMPPSSVIYIHSLLYLLLGGGGGLPVLRGRLSTCTVKSTPQNLAPLNSLSLWFCYILISGWIFALYLYPCTSPFLLKRIKGGRREENHPWPPTLHSPCLCSQTCQNRRPCSLSFLTYPYPSHHLQKLLNPLLIN